MDMIQSVMILQENLNRMQTTCLIGIVSLFS